MKLYNRTIAGILVFFFLAALLHPSTVRGITIKEEEELAREFMKYVSMQFEIIDDPMVNNYINAIGNKILAAFPPQPFTYHFYVVKEEVYNAFATPAGHIFIYSGLIAAMDNEDQLAGILAHEISHVYCRHISQKIERSKLIGIATLAGVAAGVFLGAAGGGQAASALTMGSMAAGQSAALAFSREDEIQADQVGLVYLDESGYSAEGLVTILNKIREKQWYGSDQVPSYLMTHPAVEDRLAYVDAFMEKHKHAANHSATTTGSKDFRLMHARIMGLYTDEGLALRKFQKAVDDNAADAVSYYGYGLALARAGKSEEAVAALKKALTTEAFNPAILAALGRVYFLDGRFEEALTTLESALSLNPQQPEALFFMGRTRLELGQAAAAEAYFKTLQKQGAMPNQAHYFLGKAYGQLGKMAEAHYSLGRYYYLKHDYPNARIQFSQALEKAQDAEMRKDIQERLKEIKEDMAAAKQQEKK